MKISPAERILLASDHPVSQQIATHVARGASFTDVMNAYDIHPEKEAQIHEYKSRIQELMREGVPIEHAVKSVFTDKAIIKEVINAITEYKHRRDALNPDAESDDA